MKLTTELYGNYYFDKGEKVALLIFDANDLHKVTGFEVVEIIGFYDNKLVLNTGDVLCPSLIRRLRDLYETGQIVKLPIK